MLAWQGPRNGVPLAAERVYVGRDRSKAAVINLSDPNGKPRLRLKVDAGGEPSLEFLDDKGNVTGARARLTLTGATREEQFGSVLLSRSRYLAPALHSARFYREYFRPTAEHIVEKIRDRWLIAAHVRTLQERLRPARGAGFAPQRESVGVGPHAP